MKQRPDLKRRSPLPDYWTWVVCGSFAVGVVLNAVVRPFLAGRLGGEEIRRGAAVRGSDRWWVFDEATRAEHPWMTGFLERSDGQVGVTCLVLIVILILGRWAVKRLRRAS